MNVVGGSLRTEVCMHTEVASVVTHSHWNV